MATIQRPTKEGSVRTYQEKVGLGFVDILASDVVARRPPTYAAWNGGVDSVTLKNLSVTTPKLADGAVTYAKLAADAQLWRDTGTALTPGPNFTTRLLSIPIGFTAQEWGSRPIKARLASASASDTLYLTINQGLPAGAWVKDDVAKSGWILAFDSAADALNVYRTAPGSSTLTGPLTLDSAGKLTLSTYDEKVVTVGTGAVKAGFGANAS